MDAHNLLIIAIFLLLIGYLYFHLRAKSGFRYLKSKFGKRIEQIYGYPTVDRFVANYTSKLKTWLDVKDSIIIDIDGKCFPLIFGGVVYPNYHHTQRSATNAYYLIADEANKSVIEGMPDLFKFAETDGNHSLYWAIDIKGLIAFKNNKDRKRANKSLEDDVNR